MNSKKVVENIRKHLYDYLSKYGIKSLVIGESGGIDSALCSVLAKSVCDKLGVQLIGRSITIETNRQDEVDRGMAIGNSFCHNFQEVNLTDMYLSMKDELEKEPENGESEREIRVRLGNVKARIRMVYLYNLAQKYNGMVLSTDNYTEYLLGFWTLHGDVGDYGMIQELWKTEVYEISKYLVENELEGEGKKALQLCIDAVPTDGLGITSSDLEQIEAKSYSEVDLALKEYISSGKILNQKVIDRHLGSIYKRSNPFNLKREDIVD